MAPHPERNPNAFSGNTRRMKPPRRRSLPLASQQKSFLYVSDFARAGFFLPRLRRDFGGQGKGKENFFAGFCSQRAGRLDWPLFFARTRRNSPHPPSAVFLRGRTGFLAAAI